jgi:hypothetical protein
VRLSRGFWLADTVCTQALWQAVTGANPSHFKDDARNPVESVSWDDVQAFLSELNRRVPGLQARLPSEAEWEYACRAGTTTPFSFGDNITPEQVNYDGNQPYAGGEKGLYRQKTVPAGSLPANPWGLYEMHGNVWEWCADWYGDYPNTPQVDPTGPQTGGSRVLRGGSWNSFRQVRALCRPPRERARRPLPGLRVPVRPRSKRAGGAGGAGFGEVAGGAGPDRAAGRTAEKIAEIAEIGDAPRFSRTRIAFIKCKIKVKAVFYPESHQNDLVLQPRQRIAFHPFNHQIVPHLGLIA